MFCDGIRFNLYDRDGCLNGCVGVLVGVIVLLIHRSERTPIDHFDGTVGELRKGS